MTGRSKREIFLGVASVGAVASGWARRSEGFGVDGELDLGAGWGLTRTGVTDKGEGLRRRALALAPGLVGEEVCGLRVWGFKGLLLPRQLMVDRTREIPAEADAEGLVEVAER